MSIKEFFEKSRWKLKAIHRSKEINSLKKRNKELVISRDKSKTKNNKLRVEKKEMEEKITELESEFKKN